MWPAGYTKSQFPKWPENYAGELWLESEKETRKCSKSLKYTCNCNLPSWYIFVYLYPILFCKTQNSGLRSKEEKPCDPINQPSRCNPQEGLLSFAQTGDSDLLGGRSHRTANWASFICSMLHTGYKVIGYTFAKQSYWYKLRGLLFKFKAILLVQTVRAFVQI